MFYVKIAIAIQKKKKEKTAKFKRTKKLFFARNEHRKIQLFVFHCFETKVSPNVFNKCSLAECRYLGPRPWPAHYAGHLHSHDFEQVLTTIGKLGGRGPSCVHGRRAKVCEKVNRTRRFSTAPRYNGSIVRVSSSWQGVFYCGGAGNGGRRGLATRDGKWARNIHGPRHEIGGRAANNPPRRGTSLVDAVKFVAWRDDFTGRRGVSLDEYAWIDSFLPLTCLSFNPYLLFFYTTRLDRVSCGAVGANVSTNWIF